MKILSEKVNRKLLSLSLCDDGLLDDDRISCVLSSLSTELSGDELRKLLIEYLNILERFRASHTLYIDHSGELSEDCVQRLREKYQTMFDRPLFVVTKESEDLIAGLRIRLDDFVFECSIASALDNYRKSFSI